MKYSSKTKQPRKQRKAMYNAPLHVKRKLLNAHLSRELRKSSGKRSELAAKGDTVKMIRGRFKGASGKITKVDYKRGFVAIEGLVARKQAGREVPARVRPNHFVITAIAQERKIAKTASKQAVQKVEQKVPAQPAAQTTTASSTQASTAKQ